MNQPRDDGSVRPPVPSDPPPHGGPAPWQQPGWRPWPVVPAPGWARLVVDCSYNALFLLPTGLTIMVDGQRRASSWGRTVVDLPPGPHHLHVHAQVLGRVGKVDTELSLAPGEIVHLYYRAPLNIFSPGRLGPTPQRAAGAVLAALILAVLVVGGVLVIALVS